MSYFEFPHTRTYEGDLGYILKQLTELTQSYDTFFKYNTIKFADPIEWDITKQYAAFTIVFDTDDMVSMISKQPVPAGITLDNQDYWSFVGPLIVDGDARQEIERILQFISGIYEGSSDTATALRNVGDYIIVHGVLYKVIQTINVGEYYTEGYNIQTITIEEMAREVAISVLPTIDMSLDVSSTNPIANQPVATKFLSVDANINNVNNNIDAVNSRINAVNTSIANLTVDVNDNANAISSEIATRAAADTLLSDRIDSVASLPPGSTAGNAELLDIRINQNGITYPSAGDSVRGQAANFDGAFSTIGWEPIAFKDGYYIMYTTPTVDIANPTADAGWRCAVITCAPGDNFIINCTAVSNPVPFMFLNSSKASIMNSAGASAVDNLYVTAPAGAAYLVINDYPKTGKCFKGNVPAVNTNLGNIRKNLINMLAERVEICENDNLYDYYNVKVGHIQPSNGSINTNVIADYHYSPTFAKVTAGETLTSSHNPIPVYYDINFGFIGTSTFSGNQTTVPAGAYYARFSFNEANFKSCIVNHGSSLIPGAKPYKVVINELLTKKEVVVDASGRGDYTMLTDALYNSDADIVVYPGTYDLVTEYKAVFGNSIFNNISDSYTAIGYFRYGLYVDNRKVRFVPGSYVVCDLTGVLTVDGTHRFSPFNLGANAVLDGLNCTATKTFYLIHDDFGDDSYYTNITKNCVLVNVDPVNANVIGGGTRSHCLKIVDNCYMDNGLTPDTITLRYHNYNSADATPTVIVKNCRANAQIQARYWGDQVTPKMIFIANNNSTGGGIVKAAEGGAVNDNVTLLAWGNVIE